MKCYARVVMLRPKCKMSLLRSGDAIDRVWVSAGKRGWKIAGGALMNVLGKEVVIKQTREKSE